MPIEMKKEAVMLNETICHMNCQTFVEADMIVPDIKPDIIKILQVDANPVLMEKILSSDKVIFEGRIDICIMYSTDNGCVKCIKTHQSFSHQVNHKGIMPDMCVEAYAALDNIDCRLINSRKVSINATVGIEFCITGETEVMFTTGLHSGDCYESLYEPVKAYVSERPTCEEVSLREALDVPQGKPDIDDVLKFDIKITGKDVKITGNKAVIKCDILCSTLYACDADPSAVHHMEHELGLTEIIDVPFCEQDQTPELELLTKYMNTTIKQDSDGDNRVLFVELVMDANIKKGQMFSINMLKDAYSINSVLDIKKKNVTLDEIVCDTKIQSTVKSTAVLPNDVPDIAQVYNVVASPVLGDTVIEKGRVTVNGNIETVILYQSRDIDLPVNSHKYIMPYSQVFELDDAEQGMACDVRVDVEHVNYTLSLSNEIDLRCILGMNLRLLKYVNAEYIDVIDEQEIEKISVKPAYSIKIYFVQPGDTLWNIAKKYHVTLSGLMSLNGLDESSVLLPGQQVMVP